MNEATPDLRLASWRCGGILFVMFLSSVLSQTDRQLVNILLEPIKHELHATDAQMGLLSGLYFVIFYVLAGIPIARLADRGSRRAIAASCMTVWSFATGLSGFTQSYAQLAVARAVVATGEGGCTPAIYSLITSIFPVSARTRALSFFTSGTAVGSGLGIFLGGTLVGALGWRHVFMVVALPGFVLAPILLWVLPEPRRAEAAGAPPPPGVFATMRDLLRTRTFPLVGLAAIVGSIGAFGAFAWTPAFLGRVHHMSHAEIGLKLGIATSLGLVLGNLSAGYLADRLGSRDSRWALWIPALGFVFTLPTGLLSVFSPSANLSVILSAGFSYFIAFWPPPIIASVIRIADQRAKTVAGACIALCTSIGAALGPFVMGAMNDAMNQAYGPLAVRYSIAASVCVCATGAILCLFAGHALPGDLERRALAERAAKLAAASA